MLRSTLLKNSPFKRTLTPSIGAVRPYHEKVCNLLLCVTHVYVRSLTLPPPSLLFQVIDHYERPRNVGTLDKKDKHVGTGLVGAPACGDVMKLQIKVDEVSGKITDVKFKTFGCGSAIASSSYMSELVNGMTLDEAGAVKNTTIAKELSLPPVKLHCSSMYLAPQSTVIYSPSR
jgi:Fe-S cluster assembly scaffold IscU